MCSKGFFVMYLSCCLDSLRVGRVVIKDESGHEILERTTESEWHGVGILSLVLLASIQ